VGNSSDGSGPSATVETLLSPEGRERYSGDGEVKPSEDDAQFTDGHAAGNQFAVRYQGAWETPWDGTCTAVRLHARAIAKAGLPVLLESFHRTQINQQGFPEPAHGNIADSVAQEVGHLVRTEAGTLVPTIKHLVVRDADHLRMTIMPRSVAMDTVSDPEALVQLRQSVYASTILFTVWERDRVDKGIVTQLSRCGQVWVPCLQNASMLVESGVPAGLIAVTPHPYDPDSPLCKLTNRQPIRERRFYSISGAWQPRKGYHELLGAFLRAFKPDDAVRLTLKYNPSEWEDYPSPQQSLQHWLADDRVVLNGWDMTNLVGKLQMIEGRLKPSEITKLHFDNNIYVSSSHGEAWCLPAFDAKVAGNRLVHVPYGGTADFDDPQDERVTYGLAPAHPSYNWEPDAKWADYRMEELMLALQRARPPERYERSERFESAFSLEACGVQMVSLIMHHLQGRFAKAHRHYERLLERSSQDHSGEQL